MSEPLDQEQVPDQYREQMESLQRQLTEAQEAMARFDGISADPATLKAALQMHEQYTDPVNGAAYREAMARQWGVLREGQSLDDLRAINEQIAAAQSAGGFDFDDPDSIDPQQFIQMLDKRYASNEALRNQNEELRRQLEARDERAAMESDLRALDAQERALWRSLEGEDIEITDFDKEATRAILKDRLTRDLVDGNNFHTAFEDAWMAYRSGVDARAKQLMQQQSRKPKVSDDGVTPGEGTPVTDHASAMKRLSEVFNN
jgi:hypothetical protein